MQITVLSSGSKGNSSLIRFSDGAVLLDAGLSGTRLLDRIHCTGTSEKDIRAIVITHDHSDHIKGAGIMARKLRIPVYIHEMNYIKTKRLFDNCETRFISGDFNIDNLTIEPFPISHDGTVTYAYNFLENGKKLSHVTDLGVPTMLVQEKIKDSDLIVMESNHDPEMLRNGKYPWYLKQRIASRQGHLSNRDACKLIWNLKTEKLKHVILAHLSEENNDPQIALDLMQRTRDMSTEMSYKITVASQSEPTTLLDV